MPPLFQRQVEEEEELVQAKPLAAQVTPLVQKQVEEEEEELAQTKPLTMQITPLVQRQAEEEEEELLQTKERSDNPPEVSAEVEDQINSLRGGGQSLPEHTRAFMEPRIGYDFGQVRVHTYSQANNLARSVNAQAFTRGRDIVFGPGRYQPQTPAGQQLLAHELTHVVQQNGGLLRPASRKSSMKSNKPGDTFEREADYVARQESFGTNKVRHNLSVSSPLIQRACGPTAIKAMVPASCTVGDHTFVAGSLFKFKVGCDDFAPGQQAALIGFVSVLPPTATLEIHSYASVDTATYNEQLSCARSLKAKSVLTATPPGGAGIAASRITTIVDHGPTPGPADERRSVAIRTATPTPTPTTPPAHAFRCGPDVSSPVRAAIAKVRSTWGGWSASQRDSACDALDARSSAAFAWDINELHNQAWILGYQPTCATAGASPPCHNSVEVDRNCYYAGSANYVIFGTMCKLCDGHLGWNWHTPFLGWIRGFPEWYMRYLINLYKGGVLPWRAAAANFVPSSLWATAGYRSWPSGGTPPVGDRPGCNTGCPTGYTGSAFSVHWHPHGWF